MIIEENRGRVIAASTIWEDFLEEVALELEMLLSEGLKLQVLNVSSLPAWAAPCVDFLCSLILVARNHIDPKSDSSDC